MAELTQGDDVWDLCVSLVMPRSARRLTLGGREGAMDVIWLFAVCIADNLVDRGMLPRVVNELSVKFNVS
jgi:hypothetical protein